MSVEAGYDSFKGGWQTHWEKDLFDEIMRSKYRNISIMLKIEPGDSIVVPKVSVNENI